MVRCHKQNPSLAMASYSNLIIRSNRTAQNKKKKIVSTSKRRRATHHFARHRIIRVRRDAVVIGECVIIKMRARVRMLCKHNIYVVSAAQCVCLSMRHTLFGSRERQHNRKGVNAGRTRREVYIPSNFRHLQRSFGNAALGGKHWINFLCNAIRGIPFWIKQGCIYTDSYAASIGRQVCRCARRLE